MDDLFDEASPQVVVEAHHSAGKDGDKSIHVLARQEFLQLLQAAGELSDDHLVSVFCDRRSSLADGGVIFIGQCRGDSGEVLSSGLKVDRPIWCFSLQVVTDDPDRPPGQVSGERTDGLVLEDRFLVPGVCNSRIAQCGENDRCIGEEELFHDEKSMRLG